MQISLHEPVYEPVYGMELDFSKLNDGLASLMRESLDAENHVKSVILFVM